MGSENGPWTSQGQPDQAHLVQTQMCSSMALKDQIVQGSDFQEVLSPPRPHLNHGIRCLPSRQFLEPDSDSTPQASLTTSLAQLSAKLRRHARRKQAPPVQCSARREEPAPLPISLCLSGHLAPAPPPSVLVPRCHPFSSSLAK